MAAKRARTPDELEFRIVDPTTMSDKIPDFQMRAATPGARVVNMAKKPLTHVVRFNTSTPPVFWQLWKQFDAKMLRKESESVPFTDFEAPLSRMKERTFILCDWTPEYEPLRIRLEIFKRTRTSHILREKIETARAELAKLEAALADNDAALAEAQSRSQ